MDAESIHQILVPYLEASALFVAVLGVAAFLMKRDGDRQRAAHR